MKIFILGIAALCCFGACSENNTQKSADNMIETWFTQEEWKEGFQAKPAPSVDKKQLYEHYRKFPERWKIVFDFLKNNDLKTIPLGTTQLSKDVYFNMQEYTTRDLGEQILEAHQQYIDLQYVISGNEFIGSGCLADATNVTVYDDSTDYAGYKLPIFPYYLANSEYFFVFFPNQPHLPGIQAGEKSEMRKIVFKIKVD